MQALRRESEPEAREVESAEAPDPLSGVQKAPEETPSSSAPTTLPTSDADQTVKTFSFGGQVATLSLPSLTPATTKEVSAFFLQHQDKVPTAISLSGNAAIFTFGDQHLKVSVADLNSLRNAGDIADNSSAMEALRVAKTIASVPGLTPQQSRDLTRNFVRSMQPTAKGGQGLDPSKARLEAYTNAMAALRLGPDPVGQLNRDLTVVQNLANPKAAKVTGATLKPEVKATMETLLQQRTQAVANGNFAKAADLQDELAALADKHKLPPMGARITDLPEPALDPHPLTESTFRGNDLEKELLARARTLKKGDSIDFSNALEGGFQMGIGVGLKLKVTDDISSPALVSADVSATARAHGHTKGAISCDENGDFVVKFQHFVGAGAKVGASLKALIELAGADAAGSGGCMVNFQAKCASFRDASKLLADMVDNDDSVKNVPKRASGKPDRPQAGQFIMLSQSFGLGTKTETETRRFAVTLPSEKSTIVNGQGNLVRDNLPGTATKKVNTATSRWTNTDGSKVVDRAYGVTRTGGNLALKILTLGIVGRTTTNSQVSLNLKAVTPPPLAKGFHGPTLPTKFEPDLSVKISSSKVKACKDLAAVDRLVEKEFAQMLTVMQAGNKDVGHAVFDMSPDGLAYAKESLRKGFMLIYNDANNMGIGQGQIRQDADSVRTDVGLFVSGNGASGGVLRGDLVTIKLPFNKGDSDTQASGFRATTGNVAVGMTSTYGDYFEASLGVDTGIKVPVASVSAKVYIKGAGEQGGFTEVIGRNTVEQPVQRPTLQRSPHAERLLKDLVPDEESPLFTQPMPTLKSNPRVFDEESATTKQALKTLLSDSDDSLFTKPMPTLKSNPRVFDEVESGESESSDPLPSLAPKAKVAVEVEANEAETEHVVDHPLSQVPPKV
jgi:hypothetical protein